MINKHTITRTISIKLITSPEQSLALGQLQKEFNIGCNMIVPIAVKNRCWNPVDLHHASYYDIRRSTALSSQMVCNAIKKVAYAYKVKKIKKDEDIPTINFRANSSVHFDKRTYTLKGDIISLTTLSKRIHVPMKLGSFQQEYLKKGFPKEAELFTKNGHWVFNLVLNLPPVPLLPKLGKVLGVDLGENNLVATSAGKIIKGARLRHERNKYLALRRRLQSNGSKSAKQRLKKISGREARHIKHENHVISKDIVDDAMTQGLDTIVLENLTNIRKRIKAGKRLRFRLHGWAWAQLQTFIEYKAEEKGLSVIYVNPAYTSQTCAECGVIGSRIKHRFICKSCGIQRHSDLNASQNIRRIVMSADVATGTVNCPYV